MKQGIVFIHGWGLCSAVWREFALLLKQSLRQEQIALDVCLIDLPGYGENAHLKAMDSVEQMAQFCLDNAPEKAVWVGWSLGGMVALKAALLQPERISGLQLLNTFARFTRSEDWPEGVDITHFQRFCDGLKENYQKTLMSFLLLQAGSAKQARALAKKAMQSIKVYPQPSAETLQAGIDCLARTDLRSQLKVLSMPVQVVCGVNDRVANPKSSFVLAECLQADLYQLKTGHAPFLSMPAQYAQLIMALLTKVG